MADLRTRYLGLELANPLVPSASPLSRALDDARRLEDAGAAALVMYSLFEEELQRERASAERFLLDQDFGHAEAAGYLPDHGLYRDSLDAYLEQLVRLKAALGIPVIASLNGISTGGWLQHGRALEEAGADALELNVYHLAADPRHSAAQVEQRYLDLLGELRTVVSLPVTMKLSPQFSSLPHFLRRLEEAGARGAALFNRFYQPDIDLEDLGVVPRLSLSTPAEALLRVRWIALLHGRTALSLAATGGVHTAEDALKMLLAGADAVHLCSALLRHGPARLTDILRGLDHWLDAHGYDSVAAVQGLLSARAAADPTAYERANYVQILDSHTPSPGVWR